MKTLTLTSILFIDLGMTFLPYLVRADSVKEYKVINIHQSFPIQITNKPSGIALGIATAQHNFDLGTSKTQISIGAGSYDGNNALSIGAGKRIGDSVLLNGSIGKEGGNTGIGAGITMRF